ncbi:MAG: hypothetical protein ACRBCT_03270 [Alphaproteobacteria bacterium]
MVKNEAKIQNLLEQTSDAFQTYYGGVNTDYADFATNALADFRTLLGTPDLTDRQLKSLIRRAAKRRRSESVSRDCWASFTAQYMTRKSNANAELQTV